MWCVAEGGPLSTLHNFVVRLYLTKTFRNRSLSSPSSPCKQLVSRASPLPSAAPIAFSTILKAIGAAEGSGLARETSCLHGEEGLDSDRFRNVLVKYKRTTKLWSVERALPISIQSFTITDCELETLFHQATFLICSPTLMGYRPSSPSTANVGVDKTWYTLFAHAQLPQDFWGFGN